MRTNASYMEASPWGWKFAHHIADDASALAVGVGRPHARVVHAEEHAPVHGLEAVAHVGQRSAHDHTHGVVEIRGPHLVGDLDLVYAAL